MTARTAVETAAVMSAGIMPAAVVGACVVMSLAAVLAMMRDARPAVAKSAWGKVRRVTFSAPAALDRTFQQEKSEDGERPKDKEEVEAGRHRSVWG